VDFPLPDTPCVSVVSDRFRRVLVRIENTNDDDDED